jgi:hypothetical protein
MPGRDNVSASAGRDRRRSTDLKTLQIKNFPDANARRHLSHHYASTENTHTNLHECWDLHEGGSTADICLFSQRT